MRARITLSEEQDVMNRSRFHSYIRIVQYVTRSWRASGNRASRKYSCTGHKNNCAVNDDDAARVVLQPVQALPVVGQGARHGSLQLMVEQVQTFLGGVHALARCVLELVC